MAISFYSHAIRMLCSDQEYTMSQIGKTIKKVTIKPETTPVPPKSDPAPKPVEEPVETPA